jgi:hypothetical protein
MSLFPFPTTRGRAMKKPCSCPFGSRAILLIISLLFGPLLLGASALAVQGGGEGEGDDPISVSAVREELGVMYEAWGAARVAYDREVMEEILAPEFLVQLYGQEISRDRFVGDISRARPGGRLTRFDASILTLVRGDEEWTVVITEKIEFEITGADGGKQKMSSLWITRDGWRREGERWLATSSEAIGHEYWMPGTEPPFPDW